MTTTFAPRPELAVPRPYAFPAPLSWVLPNGLRVEFFPSHSRLISFALVTATGTLAEPLARAGVGTLAASLREQGTSRHSGEEFAAALDRIGARLTTRVVDGATVANLEVPASRAADAFALMAETALTATYPETEFTRIRTILTEDARTAHVDPGQRADEALRSATFAPVDRASLPDTGLATTLTTLTRDQVAAFDQANLIPSNATLIIGGALDEDTVDALVNSAFGAWPNNSTRQAADAATSTASPRVLVVDRPGAVQTEMRLGALCPGATDPAHAALRVATQALGGSMNSRLSAVLREQKGYTYGIGAFVRTMPGRGLFTIATPVDAQFTGPAVDDIMSIVGDLRANGISQAECARSIDELLLGAPLQFQTASAVVAQRVSEVAKRLPAGWLNEHRTQTRAVTPEAANDAFRSAVAPSALSVGFVGDAESIMAALSQHFGSSAITVEAL